MTNEQNTGEERDSQTKRMKWTSSVMSGTQIEALIHMKIMFP